MSRILLFFALVFSFHLLAAQDLHIYYDVYRDSVTYLQQGKPVHKAELKKGAAAVLHLVNFNDYIYDVKISTTGENHSIPASGLKNIFAAGGGMNALQDLKDAAGSFGAPGFSLDGNALTDERDGAVAYESAVSQEALRLGQKFKAVLQDMSEIEEEIEELGEDIETKIEGQQFSAFKREQVMSIKTNPNLAPNKIKTIAMEYMEGLLDIKSEQAFDLEKMYKRSAPENAVGGLIKSYQAETDRLEAKFTELNAINRLLGNYNLQPTDQISFLTAFTEAEKRKTAYHDKVAIMKAQMDQLEGMDIREFAAIYYLYEEMKDHDFEKKIILRPETDLTRINITLTPIDSVGIQGVRTRTLSPLTLEVFGGLKINASVGLSFAGFFNRPQAYFVRDDRIFAHDLDAFTPIVTSFIHFHPQSRRHVSLGGAFGLGIGIGGENSGLQNYFLGPSLIAGKRQRIVFSTGLMTGKLHRLSQGYRVGDSYDESIIPTHSIYELGYFLGISFNFLGGQ